MNINKKYKVFFDKTKKIFDIEEQIKREKAKNIKLKKKKNLYDLKVENIKLKNSMVEKDKKDPFENFFS